MAKGQKEAVIEEVLLQLPNFTKYTDNAILLLTHTQLETIKINIANRIFSGDVEYGKDTSNVQEVKSYSRSMVMNHLKKAKELNGGHKYTTTASTSPTETKPRTVREKVKVAPKGVNPDLLTDELKEFAKTLV